MLKKNYDDIVKIGEIIVEGNQVRNKPKKKWIGVIKEEMRTCRINKNMVRDRKG